MCNKLNLREFGLKLLLKIKVAFVHVMQNYFLNATECDNIKLKTVLTQITLRMDHHSLCEH